MRGLRITALACLALLGGVLAGHAAEDGLKGPAAGAVRDYMRRTKAPCFRDGAETACTIASLDLGASLFTGKAAGAPERAVAFVAYQYDDTGNATDQMAIVLRRSGKRWVPVGRADRTTGTEPRDVRFERGAISYAGTVLADGDSRVDPTGEARFRLDLGPRGVRFVDGRTGKPQRDDVPSPRGTSPDDGASSRRP